MTFCQQCRTQPATLKRAGQVVCVDCYNEQPLPAPGQWDKVINPVYILAIEARLEVVELRLATLEKLIGKMEADS